MSGFVAVLHRDGAPVARSVLERMMTALAARGPDAQRLWLDGPVALGHAWLRLAHEAPVAQPLGEGGSWIVADARLDDRAGLDAALAAAGDAPPPAGDGARLLRAHRRWGDEGLARVRGDFAFALWEAGRRRLVCARDQLGVRPLYYAVTPRAVVVSNTLDCVRLHPDVGDELDEQAIGDFLLFGAIQDPEATAFRMIRRLPAGHRLTVAASAGVRRYWALPVDGEVRYRRREDYLERFRELFEGAVADRLPEGSAGILMSGGLDSTSVAAAARRHLGAGVPALRAHSVCHATADDPERQYAVLAAGALGMPIHQRFVEDYEVFARWAQPGWRTPEPEGDALLAIHRDLLADVARHARIALTGHGGDPAFRVPLGYALSLARRGRLATLARQIADYTILCRRPLRVRWRVHARAWLGRPGAPLSPAPAWLDPGFLSRLDTRPWAERAGAGPGPVHASRPQAYALLTSPDWPALFETFDPGTTGVPVSVRHPFFDVRLLEFLLAIPPLPWCFDKTILRLTVRGLLPEAVRLRPKTPAVLDALVAALRRPGAAWVDGFEPTPALRAYVRRRHVPAVHGHGDATHAWTHSRPLCLDHWLRARTHDLPGGGRHDGQGPAVAQAIPASHAAGLR